MSNNKSPLTKVKSLLSGGKQNFVIILAAIVLFVVFYLINPGFASKGNLLTMTKALVPYAILSLGVTFVIATGGIDLSLGTVMMCAALLGGYTFKQGLPLIVSLFVVILVGVIFGLINGLMIAKVKLPPFIATLGTMFCARGVAYMANDNRNTDAIVSGLGKEAGDAFQNFFYYGKTLGIYNAFWIAFVIFLVVFFIMSKTRTGRHIYAIGSNVEAAKLSGINVFATTTKAYLISAFCSFVIGLILAGQAGMGNMEAGVSYEMYGVAAGVIGGISPLGGSGLLLGAFAGAGVWQTLENGLGIIGAPVGIQRIVIGVIVSGAVLIDVLVRQGGRKKAKK